MPLLANKLKGLTSLADQSAATINAIIDMPADRIRSRTVSGVFIPALHKLLEVAHQYDHPSP